MSFSSPEQVSAYVAITDTLVMRSITLDTATYARRSISRQRSDGTTVAAIPADDYPFVLSNTNTCGIIHEGIDTQFSQLYYFTPPRKFTLKKIVINLAFGHDVTWVAGSPNLDSVTIGLFQDSSTRINLINTASGTLQYATGLSALGASGTQIFILNDAIPVNKEINESDPIAISIATNVTAGSGGTARYEGVIPFFCYQALSSTKWFSQSGIGFEGI